MAELVPMEEIEEIVGQKRHTTCHYGRAVSAEKTVYIMHSRRCLASTPDLLECEYSVALDAGIPADRWRGFEDEAVVLYVEGGQLLPLGKPREPGEPAVSRA